MKEACIAFLFKTNQKDVQKITQWSRFNRSVDVVSNGIAQKTTQWISECANGPAASHRAGRASSTDSLESGDMLLNGLHCMMTVK